MPSLENWGGGFKDFFVGTCIHVRFGPSQLSCLGSSVVERSV